MFKIDIHTHILPENLNELTESFSDPRFLRMDPVDDQSAMLNKDGAAFRKVDCNCWSHPARTKDCKEYWFPFSDVHGTMQNQSVQKQLFPLGS